ncbi:MAG TPA: PQQ-dependent sugar dehydrogenase [Acidimicrobiales bacterium]|nr:PQQ-dependent sugar dehydrogenase [Acidimicrobiales bacterium]
MIRRALVLISVALLLAGCDGSGTKEGAPAPTAAAVPTTTPSEPGASTTTPAPAPSPAEPDLAGARFRVQKVAALQQPTAMAVRAGDDAVYVTEKVGRVRRIPNGQTPQPGAVDPAPVLDITNDTSKGGEQGLLGLTFSPDGSKLYVDYTDTEGDTRVVEYVFNDGRADPATRRELLFVDQPYANHNGGQVSFGPDGKLYIGLGDGGGQKDPERRGQNLSTLLAKILRIDPTPSGGQPYTVPADNPFVGRAGARPETWVWGLRNPWRFSWDRQTQDLWIGDVGQDEWEEVDFLPAGRAAGANLGWSDMDSRHRLRGDNPDGAFLPITEYNHDDGNCSVAGGYVYRGSKVPALAGAYLYADTCTGKLWGLVEGDGRVVDQRELPLNSEGGNGHSIVSFGEDAAGELYLLDLSSGIYRFEPAA